MAKRDFSQLAQKAFTPPVTREEEAVEMTEREGPRAGTQRFHNARLVALTRIRPDPEQIRQIGKDRDSIQEIAQSIRRHGVLQPIALYYDEEEDIYRIITGERRYLGAEEAGLENIPAIVRERPTEHEIAFLQLTENLQREDLNPVDEARGMKRLSQEFHLNNKQIAEQLGKSESYVSRTIRLNDLPDTIREEATSLQSPGLSKEHLLQVVREKTAEDQIRLWDKIKTGELNIRQARQAVRREQPRSAVQKKMLLEDLMSLEKRLHNLKLEELSEEDKAEISVSLRSVQEHIEAAISQLQL